MNEPPASLAPVVLAASGFAALGSEQRIAVLLSLVRAGPNGLSIGALGDRCGLSGSTLTHHLKTLAHAELIRQSRDGRHILCTANYDRIQKLSDFLLSECCRDCGTTDEAHDHD